MGNSDKNLGLKDRSMTWKGFFWRRNRRPRIFISYRRRGDGAGYGGRLADSLVDHFGREQCFLDVDGIESGVDFIETIRSSVAACEVLIAVIGPDWITQADASGRPRLEDPNDFVRLEVAAALERNIRVIPVLVGGAQVPTDDELPHVLKALSRRQTHELTDSRWDYDVEKLLKSIESIGIRSRSLSDHAVRRQRLKLCGWVVGTATLLGTIVVFDQYSLSSKLTGLASGRSAALGTMQWEHKEDIESALRDEELHGDILVVWMYQGALHKAEVVLNGKSGYARVLVQDILGTGITYELIQDLSLERRAGVEFYVGSNVRALKDHLDAVSVYSPDIFKIERLTDGRWTINEVGMNWGLFVRAEARFI
jgi:hypothetical protein